MNDFGVTDFDRYPGVERDTKFAKKVRGLMDLCDCNKKATHTHHKDCNPGNDVPENIRFMCGTCHLKLHAWFPNWRHLTDENIEEIIRTGLSILNKIPDEIKMEKDEKKFKSIVNKLVGESALQKRIDELEEENKFLTRMYDEYKDAIDTIGYRVERAQGMYLHGY